MTNAQEIATKLGTKTITRSDITRASTDQLYAWLDEVDDSTQIYEDIGDELNARDHTAELIRNGWPNPSGTRF